MPRFVDTRDCAAVENYKRELINKDLLRCYKELCNEESVIHLIRSHRYLINKMNLNTHNKKRPTLDLLIHYRNTADKVQALYILTNSLNNKGLFSKFLSEEQQTEKQWKARGTGHTC
jgi:hypothetical protein